MSKDILSQIGKAMMEKDMIDSIIGGKKLDGIQETLIDMKKNRLIETF